MLEVTRKYAIRTMNTAVYLSLLTLGCFFVHKGDVLQRYQQKKSNFAEYAEPITELPTFVTWIEPFHLYLKMGRDLIVRGYIGF